MLLSSHFAAYVYNVWRHNSTCNCFLNFWSRTETRKFCARSYNDSYLSLWFNTWSTLCSNSPSLFSITIRVQRKKMYRILFPQISDLCMLLKKKISILFFFEHKLTNDRQSYYGCDKRIYHGINISISLPVLKMATVRRTTRENATKIDRLKTVYL